MIEIPEKERFTVFQALATDYDGTLAEDGVVSPNTMEALERFQASGRQLILVTGRELPELKQVFPGLCIFDRVVAENGALLHVPASDAEELLAPSPSELFVEELKKRGVSRLSVGRSIVATWKPFLSIVANVIEEMGLDLVAIENKDAVMVLPHGVDKASGLAAALADLDIQASSVVGVGDAENDYPLLSTCGLGAAVANALPSLKERANLILEKERGAGVQQLIDWIIRNDTCDPSRASAR